jgi:acetolactate decarboxylase
MTMRLAALGALLGVSGLPGCAGPPVNEVTGQNGVIAWAGEQHKAVHDGDVAAKVHLTDLVARPHLYAVGPLDGLRGEITILDGSPVIATVEGDGYRTSDGVDHGAAFLVWTYVPQWSASPLPVSVRTIDELASYLPAAARSAGLDPEQPFAFRVEGRAESLAFHVLRPPEGGFTVESHEKAKVHGSINAADVRLLGFYSTAHHGVFTPGTSDVHVHFVTADGKLAGHVEDFVLAPGASLMFPSHPR